MDHPEAQRPGRSPLARRCLNGIGAPAAMLPEVLLLSERGAGIERPLLFLSSSALSLRHWLDWVLLGSSSLLQCRARSYGCRAPPGAPRQTTRKCGESGGPAKCRHSVLEARGRSRHSRFRRSLLGQNVLTGAEAHGPHTGSGRVVPTANFPHMDIRSHEGYVIV